MKAIKTTFLGATNFRGSRIKATAEGGQRDHQVTIPYPHELNSEQAHQAAAKALCAKLDWHGAMITGGLRDCYVHVFSSHKLESGKDYPQETFEV